jgi:hypothetical protein
VRELPDERQDEPVPVAVAPVPPREDAHLLASSASDASDAALPDARDAADLRREPSDGGAEKLAVPALDARARDAWSRQARWFVQWVRPAVAAELYTPDAVQSAEQSCAEPEAVAAPEPLEPDAASPLEHGTGTKP